MDSFCFDTRRGFCEHYTAAFVTLMRAAGIPARAINGYLGGRGQRRRELHPRAPGRRPRLGRGLDRGVRLDAWTRRRRWRQERVELGSEALRRLAARGVAAGACRPRRCCAPSSSAEWEQAALYAPLLGRHQFYWNRWVRTTASAGGTRFLERLGLGKLPWGPCWARCLSLRLLLTAYALWQWRPTPDTRSGASAVSELLPQTCARAGLPRAAPRARSTRGALWPCAPT